MLVKFRNHFRPFPSIGKIIRQIGRFMMIIPLQANDAKNYISHAFGGIISGVI